MKKKIVLASGVPLLGAALLLTTSPAIAANPARPVAAVQSPSETAAEQAKRLNAAALKAKSAAQKAKTAADRARTKDAVLKALYAGWSAKNAGQQAYRNAQAFLNAAVPGTTADDRVLVAQGINPAKDAVSFADKAIRTATGKLKYKG